MANPNSKPLTTQNPLSAFLIIFLSFLMLMTKAKSESFSFNLPSFEPGASNILLGGDARTTGGVLQLTKKDFSGKPTKHSVGLSAFASTVHLSDTKTGRVADFFTDFSFVVNTNGSSPHGDGFTFFISSLHFDFPDNSSGGFLGLFNDKTAFNTSINQVVAVEFDTFANEWDPNFPVLDSPHIGIDISSIRSAVTAPWPIDVQPLGSIGRAGINYESSSKILSVSVNFPNSPVKLNATVLSYPVNLGALLSEYVLIGFSGATGDLVETHDILSWSFRSFL